MIETESFPVFIEPRVNRASAVFRTAADHFNRHAAPDARRFVLSYELTANGARAATEPADLQLLPAARYNVLENKASVHELARRHDVADLFPPTYTDVAAALAHPEPVAVWFAKPVHLSGGRGIQLVPGAALRAFTLPPHTLLQAGVDDLVLFRGRKFTMRAYLLLWNGAAYLFDDGFVVVHAPRYVRGSADYKVQVDHRGYQDGSTGVDMRLLSAHPKLGNIMQRTAELLRRLAPVLAPCRDACDARHFLLLGIDLLLRRTGALCCIEINAIPNFVHSASINESLNAPFFGQVMRVVTGERSDRLWKL